jgi:predicted acyltransferase
VFPINESVWTSSFALFSAGMAAQALAACHWLLDVHQWRGWSLPLMAFGRNALAAYFLSIALDAVMGRWTVNAAGASLKWEIYSRGFASWAEPCCGVEAASLLYAVAYAGIWAAVNVTMYRRRIFIGI